MPSVAARDVWIDTGRGRLFARCWTCESVARRDGALDLVSGWLASMD